MRAKRTISKEEKEYLLSIKYDEIDIDLLHELFADHYDAHKKKVVPSKFNTYDEFILEKGEYFNKDKILTNCGLFIVNKYFFEKDLSHITGYVNQAFSSKVISGVYGKLDAALLEDRIKPEQYIDFLNRLVWIAFSFNTEISTSLTVNSMKELPEVKKAREEAIKKNKEAFTKGSIDIATVAKVEAELVEVGRKALANDPAIDLYESGARGSFPVAYKNGQIIKGPAYNSATGEWEVVKSPLVNGIDKDDIPVSANGVVDSAYNKAIAPGECGYMTKKLAAAFQSVTLDEKNSDCHTKMYTEVFMDNDAYGFYKYGFIIEGSNLVRLDPSNKDKYLNKKVRMRTADYCIGKQICNKCAGDRYYLLGMKNIGLTAPRISNSMLNGRMKQMHDSTVKTFEIKESDFL